MQNLSFEHDLIRQARSSFHRGEPLDTEVRPEIMAAWLRCQTAGISPQLAAASRVSDAELQKTLALNANLIKIAEPLLLRLYQFLEGSGFAVSLSDNAGRMLYVVGDKDVLASTNGNMDIGTDWGESKVGNNAVGTSLSTDRPCQLWGFEHYTRLPQRWAGSGCPIHTTTGNQIGTIAISGPVEKSHLHTLGMVVTTAHAIEMQLKLNEALSIVNTSNEHQGAIINSIAEGLLIVNAELQITLANNIIANLIGVNRSALLTNNIKELISDKNLLQAIHRGEEVTDYITDLTFEGKYYSCTVTLRKINCQNKSPETLILIGEMMRAKNLARRINTNTALLTFSNIVGQSPRFLSTINLAKAAAETSANILILGESGTGKEIFAQSIHSESLRRNAPFVAINCGAIPKELVTSTLFGYEEGSFTGAKKGGSPGKFELADKGTLFLDEIGELSPDVQATLLRVLDQKVVTRVGGKKSVPVDARIIAATNRDLLKEVQENNFRQDLYFRLNVLLINLPTLRERKEDIALLARHFLRLMNRRYKKNITDFSEEAINLLQTYTWPGNIRELQNTIERAVVLSTGTEIDSEAFFFLPHMAKKQTLHAPPIPYTGMHPLADEIKNEKNQIISVLEEYRWNISKAAVKLGMARSTLYRKMYYYNLK